MIDEDTERHEEDHAIERAGGERVDRPLWTVWTGGFGRTGVHPRADPRTAEGHSAAPMASRAGDHGAHVLKRCCRDIGGFTAGTVAVGLSRA